MKPVSPAVVTVGELRVPAAHLRIGSKIDGLDTAIHRANYDCNEAAISVGVRVMTRAILELSSE
jgi:metal-dependent amidase/aminoacylase/carboxypeptidase family protein